MDTLQTHFQNIQQIFRQGKADAWQAVNAHALLVNWQIGAYLSQRLTESVYGDRVVSSLAEWLVQNEPNLKGCDRRSLYRMRVFFETWYAADWSLLPEIFQDSQTLEVNLYATPEQKIVATASPQSLPSIPPILLRINWSQHIDLLSSCTSHEERLFYLVLAIKDRYDVRELRRQIKSALFERQMLSKQTLILPEHPKKDLLPDIFRDKYLVEFLGLKEHNVEIAMSRQLSPTLVTAYETKFLDKKLLQRLLHDWSEEWAQRHGKDL